MIEMVPHINVVRLDFLLVQLLCGEDKRRDACFRATAAPQGPDVARGNRDRELHMQAF